MADLFLSYSRRDGEFAHRLVAALQARGKEVWIDVEGIRDGEVFPEALRRAIEGSDALVFLITPDSVASPFCNQELEHAAALNKRIVPVSRVAVPDGEIPEQVRFRNWIPATADEGFEEAVERVSTALEVDLEWDRRHSRLTVRALEWEQSGEDRSFLLRGADLEAAERWLAEGTGKDPGPTALESRFVVSARAAAGRRQRSLLAASLGVAVVSVALLVFALISRSQAIASRNAAKAQALTSDAERVAAQALVEPDVDRQMLLAVAAVKLSNRIETRSDLLAVLERNPALIRFARPFDDLLVAVQVSPDGKLLAVADASGTVRFIDLASWRQAGAEVKLGLPVAPRAMSFSPDGRTLMAMTVDGADTSKLYAIDVTTRRARAIGEWHSPVPSPPLGSDGVAYSPDGRSLAVSLISASQTARGTASAARVLMLDPRSGAVRWQRPYPVIDGEQEEPHVVFTPGGQLLSSAQHGQTILWSTRTGAIIRRYPIGGLPAISPDGELVALGRNTPFVDPVTKSWMTVLDLRTGRYRTLAGSLDDAWMRGVDFIDGDRQIVGDAFDGVHVWDVANGTIAESFVGQPGQRSVMALSPDGSTAIVGSQDGSVAAFDLSGTRRLGQAFAWRNPADSCSGDTTGPCEAVSPGSDLLADTQSNGAVAVVGLRALRLVRLLPPRDGHAADAVSFLPGGGTLVDGGTNGDVTLWSTRTWRVQRTLRFGAAVQLTAPSPDGRLLAVQTQRRASSSQVDVVQLATGKVVQTHTVPDGSGGLKFTPDGRELVAVGCCDPGSAVVAWSVSSGRRLFIDRPANDAAALDVAPHADMLGVGTADGKVLFLNARTGAAVAPPLQAAGGNIEYISFSPDGRDVAVGAADNEINVWSLAAREHLGSPIGPYPGVLPDGVFEPDGRLLAIGLETAIQLPTDVAGWERFACEVAGRDLSRAEWHALVPARPYERVCPQYPTPGAAPSS